MNKELNLNLNMPEKVNTSKFGIEVKPYLSTPEIGVIVEVCSQIDDVVARQKLIDEYILKYCADIEIANVEEYDLLLQNGVILDIKKKISNVEDIDIFMVEALQMGNVVRSALNKVIDKIPDEKTLKSLIKKFTKQFKEISKEGK